MKVITLCALVLSALVTTLAVTNTSSEPVTGTAFVQLQPYTILQPEQEVYVKVGTIGTNELQSCIGAVKVYQLNFPDTPKLESYCRMQSDGYAALYFKNEGAKPIALFDKVRVVVF